MGTSGKKIIDVIHIHDLPLTNIGVKMKRKYEIKLVCDQHEYYSNLIVQTTHLNKADLVITVEEPLQKEYINKVRVKKEHIITLPNTPERSFAKA